MVRSRKLFLAGAMLIAVFALAAPAQAATRSVSGTVVHRNSRGHSFAVATHAGSLVSIHARRSAALGRHVKVKARKLANGTFSALGVKVGGRAGHLRFHGTVTFVDRRNDVVVVSSNGVSLPVHRRSGNNAVAADALPGVGDDVVVTGTLPAGQNEVEADDIQTTGANPGQMQIEGTVLAVDPVARTLSISADDEDQLGQSVTVVVPDSLDISLYTVGQEVELVVVKQADGSLLLQGSSEDGNANQADDQGEHQGQQCDGNGDNNGSVPNANGGGDQNAGPGPTGGGSED